MDDVDVPFRSRVAASLSKRSSWCRAAVLVVSSFLILLFALVALLHMDGPTRAALKYEFPDYDQYITYSHADGFMLRGQRRIHNIQIRGPVEAHIDRADLDISVFSLLFRHRLQARSIVFHNITVFSIQGDRKRTISQKDLSSSDPKKWPIPAMPLDLEQFGAGPIVIDGGTPFFLTATATSLPNRGLAVSAQFCDASSQKCWGFVRAKADHATQNISMETHALVPYGHINASFSAPWSSLSSLLTSSKGERENIHKGEKINGRITWTAPPIDGFVQVEVDPDSQALNVRDSSFSAPLLHGAFFDTFWNSPNDWNLQFKINVSQLSNQVSTRFTPDRIAIQFNNLTSLEIPNAWETLPDQPTRVLLKINDSEEATGWVELVPRPILSMASTGEGIHIYIDDEVVHVLLSPIFSPSKQEKEKEREISNSSPPPSQDKWVDVNVDLMTQTGYAKWWGESGRVTMNRTDPSSPISMRYLSTLQDWDVQALAAIHSNQVALLLSSESRFGNRFSPAENGRFVIDTQTGKWTGQLRIRDTFLDKGSALVLNTSETRSTLAIEEPNLDLPGIHGALSAIIDIQNNRIREAVVRWSNASLLLWNNTLMEHGRILVRVDPSQPDTIRTTCSASIAGLGPTDALASFTLPPAGKTAQAILSVSLPQWGIRVGETSIDIEMRTIHTLLSKLQQLADRIQQ